MIDPLFYSTCSFDRFISIWSQRLAEWAARGTEGDGRAQRGFGGAKSGVEVGRAEAGFVHVAMTAHMILDRIDTPRRPEARDRLVRVGDRHFKSQGSRMF